VLEETIVRVDPVETVADEPMFIDEVPKEDVDEPETVAVDVGLDTTFNDCCENPD
jgi:hypothetical protein